MLEGSRYCVNHSDCFGSHSKRPKTGCTRLSETSAMHHASHVERHALAFRSPEDRRQGNQPLARGFAANIGVLCCVFRRPAWSPPPGSVPEVEYAAKNCVDLIRSTLPSLWRF